MTLNVLQFSDAGKWGLLTVRTKFTKAVFESVRRRWNVQVSIHWPSKSHPESIDEITTV